MDALNPVPGRRVTYTYGHDEFGEFGTLVAPESELQVAEPLDFTTNPPTNQFTEGLN
jgi:hypothetical protein